MRITIRNLALIVPALLVSAFALSAQETPFGRSLRPSPDSRERAKLESKMRKETEQVLRDKLKLNEDQLKKLRVIEARFQPRRDGILVESRTISTDIEKEWARGNSADQKRVEDKMQRSRDLRQSLVDLGDEEQQELLTFMTPVQVSQYISFQKQLREKVRQKERGQDVQMPAQQRPADRVRRPTGDRRMMPPGNPF